MEGDAGAVKLKKNKKNKVKFTQKHSFIFKTQMKIVLI